ncbi:NAC domain-containing protein 74, putative isoform 3, partial [Theobroma cacao]
NLTYPLFLIRFLEAESYQTKSKSKRNPKGKKILLLLNRTNNRLLYFFSPILNIRTNRKTKRRRSLSWFFALVMAGEGVSRETQMSIEASSMFPGFRFSPTDVELISYYLKKKLDGYDKCVEVISEIEICRHEPWDLPVIKSDNEWFFFCARGRKYPNGSQSRRATEQGYWKATGKERNVKSGSNVIGTKRTLVFHMGRAPKGERTEWIMHEYCMNGKSQDSLVVCRLRKNSEFRLNNTTNQASRNQQELSTMHDSRATSDGGTDQTGMSEGDKAVEFYSKKVTSSYDSHSIEQIDSASESEEKHSNDVAPTESSTPQKDSDGEEDYFAEILKDDIIKLDETSLSAMPPDSLSMVASTSDTERRTQQPRQENVPNASPFQGTASRRIKLWRPKGDILCDAASGSLVRELAVEKQSSPKIEESPKCLLSIFSPRTANLRLIYASFVILTLLALFLSLIGDSKPVKDFKYAAFYKNFWQ